MRGWWIGLVLNAIGSGIIITDMLSWLDGDGFNSSSLITAVLMILIGSYLITLRPVREETEPLDLSEIDFKVIYKEHDGKLWRYISLPDDGEAIAEAQANESYAYIGGGFRQSVVKPGSAEWWDYYINKRKNRRTRR